METPKVSPRLLGVNAFQLGIQLVHVRTCSWLLIIHVLGCFGIYHATSFTLTILNSYTEKRLGLSLPSGWVVHSTGTTHIHIWWMCLFTKTKLTVFLLLLALPGRKEMNALEQQNEKSFHGENHNTRYLLNTDAHLHLSSEENSNKPTKTNFKHL